MIVMESPRIVSREEWLEARKALMAREKELTRFRDQLAAERRALPWVKVEKQMGWRCTWVSSYHSEFNYDFHVSFTPEQIAAGRAFYNYAYVNPGLEDLSGQIFHTYSTFARGGEEFLGVYRYLDVKPNGREDGPYNTLADWVRPKDMYGKGGLVEGSGRYHQSSYGCTVHQPARS